MIKMISDVFEGSASNLCSSKFLFLYRSIGFGRIWVKFYIRVPFPAASITIFIVKIVSIYKILSS